MYGDLSDYADNAGLIRILFPSLIFQPLAFNVSGGYLRFIGNHITPQLIEQLSTLIKQLLSKSEIP